MAQSYDVSVKALFLREGNGVIRRLLFGGQVTEFLSSEQPQVVNQRGDMVVRTEDGSLHHVEFQVSNEAGFALRMLDYYAWLVRVHRTHVIQTVLYFGREPLRMPNEWTSPSTSFRFDIVNLRELDAELLAESDDWADNALALLAKGETGKVLDAVLPRLRAMQSPDRNWAAGTLLLLSGIMGLEETVDERLREGGMINVLENKVLGPIFQRRFEEGLEQGREQAREQGNEQARAALQELLLAQLADKFDSIPAWAVHQLQAATLTELRTWAKRIIKANSFEEILREPTAPPTS